MQLYNVVVLAIVGVIIVCLCFCYHTPCCRRLSITLVSCTLIFFFAFMSAQRHDPNLLHQPRNSRRYIRFQSSVLLVIFYIFFISEKLSQATTPYLVVAISDGNLPDLDRVIGVSGEECLAVRGPGE